MSSPKRKKAKTGGRTSDPIPVFFQEKDQKRCTCSFCGCDVAIEVVPLRAHLKWGGLCKSEEVTEEARKVATLSSKSAEVKKEVNNFKKQQRFRTPEKEASTFSAV